MATDYDMTPRRRRPVLAGALALMTGSALALAAAPDLSGKWRLNAAKSDDARAKIEEAMGPASPKGAGGGGGRARWIPRGEGGEMDRLRIRENMLTAAGQLEELDIAQSPTEIRIAQGDLARIFYFGRESTRQTEGGDKLKARTSWRDQQLVIDQEGEKGLRIVQVFTLLSGGAQVTHALRFEGAGLKEPLEIKLVYDREDAAPKD